MPSAGAREETSIIARISSLDTTLFDSIESQTTVWDRRALLSLHASVAQAKGRFNYLEIGSFRGGSLQALIRDPRCAGIVSIDPRPPLTPDPRGAWTYPDNTTAGMLAALAALPDADIAKVTPIEKATREIAIADLPFRPNLCFVDGEHTDEAALQDARFCLRAMGGTGVLAFHDRVLVRSGIRRFARESWTPRTRGVAFTDYVLALEFGDSEVLTAPVVRRATGSGWHSAMWRLCGRSRSVWAFLAAWAFMDPADEAIASVRSRLRTVGKLGRS